MSEAIQIDGLAAPDPKKFASELHGRIDGLVRQRLSYFRAAPKNTHKNLPKVLSRPDFGVTTVVDERYVVSVIASKLKSQRVRKDNFFGLIKPPFGASGAAIKLERSRFIVIRACEARNTFLLDLGPDCSVVLEDININLVMPNHHIEYTVDLAFLVSFGMTKSIPACEQEMASLISFASSKWGRLDER